MSGNRALVKYDLPLNEVVFDFYDRLKSVSKGYASFDYHLTDYQPSDLVKLQMLVNAEPVDALAMLVHRTRAEQRGRAMAEKAQGADSAAHVPGADPGRDRRQDHRARDRARLQEGRDREMLRRRRDPQAQAPGQAEGRQEAHAPVRQGRHPAGGVHRRRALKVDVISELCKNSSVSASNHPHARGRAPERPPKATQRTDRGRPVVIPGPSLARSAWNRATAIRECGFWARACGRAPE